MNWIKIESIGFWLERPSDYRWRLSGPLAGDEPGPLGLSNSRAQCATTNTKRTRVETMRRCRWSLEGSRLAVASTEKWSPLTSDSSTWFPPTIFWRQDNNRPRLVWRFLHFSSSFSFSSLLSCMKLVVLLAVATRQRSPFCFPIFHSSWVGFFLILLVSSSWCSLVHGRQSPLWFATLSAQFSPILELRFASYPVAIFGCISFKLFTIFSTWFHQFSAQLRRNFFS